jgi:hypothetical protein
MRIDYKKLIIKFILISTVITNLYSTEYSDWLKSQNNQYTQFKKSYDDEFADMLKKDWKNYNTKNTPSSFKKSKPKSLPQIVKTEKIPKETIIKSPIAKVKKIVKVKVNIPKNIVIEAKSKNGYSDIKFKFFNQNIKIQYDNKFQFDLYSVNKNTISKSWKSLSKTNFKSIIKQTKQYVSKYTLNDWALYLLLHKMGMNIYQNNNKANLFSWFILTKMNFDTKVAYNNDDIYLLANVKQKLFQISFFTLNNTKYNVLDPKGRTSSIGSIYTYPSSYKNATKKMSFDMNNHEISLYTNVKHRELKFKYEYKIYNIDTKYSKDLIDFYKTFPQSQYDVYFHNKKSPLIANSLLVKLKQIIHNKSEYEAVNMILRFVQTSFKYKTDDEQFTYEKVFFPEETLYYPYSDCEDRSIMFSYLVETLLDLDVVAVKYDGHLSTAVNFSTKIKGSGFTYKNKKYTIADPTYINANIGRIMPKYINANFSVLE